MNIILGVFIYTDRFACAHRVERYPFGYGTYPTKYMDLVVRACYDANIIYFMIEGVYAPVNKLYHTGQELDMIINNHKLLDKVIFIDNEGFTLDKDLILEIFRKKIGLIKTHYIESKKEQIPMLNLSGRYRQNW